MGSQHTPADLWKQIASEIRLRIPRPAFESWFSEARAEDLDDTTLMVSVPNDNHVNQITGFYGSVVSWSKSYLDIDVEIEFVARIVTPKELSELEPTPEPEVRTFGDLREHELRRWLIKWDFSWPHRLLRDYPRDLIVEILDEFAGSPDSEQSFRLRPSMFVQELYIAMEERQRNIDASAQAAAASLPRVVPFKAWHKTA